MSVKTIMQKLNPSASLIAAITPSVSAVVFLVMSELVTHGIITTTESGPIARQTIPIAAAAVAYVITLIGNEAWFRKLEGELNSGRTVNAELLTRFDQLTGQQTQTIALVNALQQHIFLERAREGSEAVPFPQP